METILFVAIGVAIAPVVASILGYLCAGVLGICFYGIHTVWTWIEDRHTRV
jgi:hypothetical protein